MEIPSLPPKHVDNTTIMCNSLDNYCLFVYTYDICVSLTSIHAYAQHKERNSGKNYFFNITMYNSVLA